MTFLFSGVRLAGEKSWSQFSLVMVRLKKWSREQ